MRILFITPRFPYPPLKGDTLRAYHQLRILGREHRITLLSIAEGPVRHEDYAEVARYCEQVTTVPLARWQAVLRVALGVFMPRPLQVSYYHSGAFNRRLQDTLLARQFDVMHVALIRMIPYAWKVRRLPTVVDLIDSLSLNLSERLARLRGPKRWAYRFEYGRVRRFEEEAVEHFSALVVSSPADRETLGGTRVSVIPNGVDLDSFPFAGQDDRDRGTLIFTGNMGYPPNEEAVLWFAAEVWPILRENYPDLRFQVVGTGPSGKVRALERTAPGVEVVGAVPDVAEYLGRATISVCPMRSGSGIQNKVLEAMATGTPVVATSLANRGVGGTPKRDLLVADDAEAFASAVGKLLGDGILRARLGHAGRAFVERHFLWEQHVQKLLAVYQAVQRIRV